MRTREAIEREIRRVRTDLAFLYGDRGGPNHKDEMNSLRTRLRELEAELKEVKDPRRRTLYINLAAGRPAASSRTRGDGLPLKEGAAMTYPYRSILTPIQFDDPRE